MGLKKTVSFWSSAIESTPLYAEIVLVSTFLFLKLFFFHKVPSKLLQGMTQHLTVTPTLTTVKTIIQQTEYTIQITKI